MTTPRQPSRVILGLTRSRLLATLEETGRPMGVRELAASIGLHPNSVREQLQVLMDAGLVIGEVAPPSGRGRPGHRYLARPDSDAEEPYRVLSRVLVDELGRSPDAGAASTSAGERWGQTMISSTGAPMAADDAIRRLIGILDDAGFEPEAPADPTAPIRLRRCPFEALAHDHETVICGVHLGLMRGALRALGAPLDAVRLRPFVEPGVCLAHLEVRDGV